MNHDLWLENQAEEYYRDCKPTAIEHGYEYEGRDENGNVEYSEWFIVNCERCNETDCEYWAEYNDEVTQWKK